MSLVVGKSNIGATVDVYANSEAFRRRPEPERVADLERFREAQKVADDLGAQVGAWEASRTYTSKGLREQVAKALKAARAAMAEHDAEVEARQERQTAIRAKATATPTGTRDLDTILTEREIRDRLAGKDPLEVNVIYLTSIERGDHVTTRAIENSPPTFPLITPEQRAVGDARKLLKSELVDAVLEADASASAYRTIVGAVHAELSALASRYGVKDED